MRRGRQQAPATSLRDSRHGLVTLYFAQSVVAGTLLLLFTTQLAPESILLLLASHVKLLARLTTAALALSFTTALAAIISVWTRYIFLLQAVMIITFLLLTPLALTLAWLSQLQRGVWEEEFAAMYDTKSDPTCPGIRGGACCGWDYCPFPHCEDAHRPCSGVIAQWISVFFIKTVPMLSVMLALGLTQLLLGCYLLRHSWGGGWCLWRREAAN